MSDICVPIITGLFHRLQSVTVTFECQSLHWREAKNRRVVLLVTERYGAEDLPFFSFSL